MTWPLRVAVVGTAAQSAAGLFAAAGLTWLYSAMSSAALYVPWESVAPLLLVSGIWAGLALGVALRWRPVMVVAAILHVLAVAGWVTFLVSSPAQATHPISIAIAGASVAAVFGLVLTWMRRPRQATAA